MNNSVQPDNAPIPSTNKKAIESLVFGLICGASALGFGFGIITVIPPFLCFAPLLVPIITLMALIAIVEGRRARVQIKERQEAQTGDKIAVVGQLLGYISIVMICLIVLDIFLTVDLSTLE